MIEVSDLPTLNATLNAIAALLLVAGRVAVKQGRERQHRFLMLSAVGVSALFLASYLSYHYLKVGGHTPYPGEGWLKGLYYLVLFPHILLAGLVLPFILAVLILGLRGKREAHRRWARRVWPVWIYVSITGVLVYLMLYVFTPGG